MPPNPVAAGCVRAFFVVWLLGWTAAVVAFDGFVLSALSEQLRTLTYAGTQGTITKSFVRTEGDMHALVIAYDFTANGRKWTGSHYCHAPMKTNLKSWHAVAAEFPVGAVVPVYYDSANPNAAVLHRGPTGFDIAMLWFLAPFNTVVVGGWVALVRAGRRSFDPADRRCVEPTDAGFRVHLPTTPRADAFGRVLLALTFAGVFVWAFGFDFNPPVALVGGAFAGALAFALGCARWYTHPVLEVDALARVLGFGSGSGALEVPFAAVSAVPVTCEEQTGSEEAVSRRYHCDLTRTGAAPVRLASYWDGESAEALAAWLRGRLGL